MTRLKNKKEFIYYLGGKYYIIGGCECKECDDQELIQLFQRFLTLTDNDEFQNYEVREMIKKFRDEVAEVFRELLRSCYVPIEESDMTDAKYELRETLETKYQSEIDSQFDRWIKADTCLFHKDVDALVAAQK